MNKNDYFEGTCIDMTHDGKGVVKVDNFAYFVNDMIVGESAKLKVIKVLKNYGIARMIDIHTPSSYRVTPKCDIYKACGGCHLQHISIEGQQNFKTKRVKDCLERIGDCHLVVEDCMMMDDPWFYRNKVQVPVGYQEGHLVTGFYKQHTNDIIPCNNCYIQNESSNALTNRVRELLDMYDIKPYDKVKKQGNIRHILTKQGQATKELMLVLIASKNKIHHMDDMVKTLVKEFSDLKTIILNVNKRQDNVILGEQEIVLYGDGYITDQLLGNTFKISSKSFYQINPIQVEKLYSKAIEYASLSKNDIVVDAYCGIGTIALSVAKYVKKVYGVEVVPQAIEDAKENATINAIDNVDFTLASAEDFMMSLTKEDQHIDVVFIDPPRKGCSPIFLEALVKLNPKKIIYISCDVSTQARDVKYLQEFGFLATKCQPVDMFPSTYHIENVVLLSNQNNND